MLTLPDHYYVTIVDFGPVIGGLGHGSEPASFDDACDALAEAMEAGNPAIVLRIEPPKDGEYGLTEDVTDQAVERIMQRCNQRGVSFPAWLNHATETVDGDDYKYDEWKESQ